MVFALKYEGVNLLIYKRLFLKLGSNEVKSLLQNEPTGQYSRKIWFLYEWLMGKQLNIPDLTVKSFIPLIDPKRQYAIKGIRSSRHRILNNLPGTPAFCPLITRTPKLERHITGDFANQTNKFLNTVRKNLLQRASAFLLLKDSKASFTIEGENPPNNRASRWGKAIGQAGDKPLSKEELLCLQQIVIENTRFTKMGFRLADGFVGEHDHTTGEPLAEKKFAQQGMLFPVSASILDKIHDYRRVLESYSNPLLDLIEWKPTPNQNMEVLNETVDYYRYFDATKQAEFLYDCVEDTIKNIIPREVDYLRKYDEMKRYLDDYFEMPDKTVALFIRFLEQNDGKLSNRAKTKEFDGLTDIEVREIENSYHELFQEE